VVVTAKGVTQAFTGHALSLAFDDIPTEVVERTKLLFLDYLGVAFGGAQVAESSGPIIDGVRELAAGAPGDASVLGGCAPLPAHYAALINATLAHSMDFDDTHREGILHIGTPLLSTLLALAEGSGASGRELLTAAVAGYDVIGKLARAHGGAVHARGFHPTATTGIFGATAAGARLLGYTPEQTANALGLNVSQSAGSLQFLANGSWNKRFHTGLTAHNAIVSLVMARHGYVGATEPIEGEAGYLALYAGGEADLAVALDGLGSSFEVMKTAVKPYPCCRYSHATIDALVEMARADGITSGDVDTIRIGMGTTAFGLVADPPDRKRTPSNVVEGQFSVYFAAAAALAGTYNWRSYDRLDDAAVRGVMARTEVTLVPQMGAEIGSTVTLTTTDGRVLSQDVPFPKGEPENPMSWDEMHAKFLEWSVGSVGEANAHALADMVGRLELVGSVRELSPHLVSIKER